MIWKEALDTAREPHHLREAIKKAGDSAMTVRFCILLNLKTQELILKTGDLKRIELFEEITDDRRERVLELRKPKNPPTEPINVLPFERRSLRVPELTIDTGYLSRISLRGMKDVEETLVKELTYRALNTCDGHRDSACKILGISSRTLRYRLRRWRNE